MIVATMLGLRPVVLPHGQLRVIVGDEDAQKPRKNLQNGGAKESKERAFIRYKNAFAALGGKATANMLEQFGFDRSAAQKWLSRYDGKFVRRYGRVAGPFTNNRLMWEWINGDE